MITYLVKMTLCALLLYAMYVLMLEKENRHRFKRIYLLASPVFSLLVPLIVLEITTPRIPVNLDMFYNMQHSETIINDDTHFHSIETTVQPENRSSISIATHFRPLLLIYITITAFFLFRLFKNCRQMLIKTRKNDSVTYRGVKIVLVNEKVVPHSFGQTIFINRVDYYGGLVPDEIIAHEWAHVMQRHTFDILFIELLITFGWFNPVFYLYRNKIRQNHEFLADEAVVGTNEAIVPDYINMLIRYIPQNKKISFTSNFNFQITKKRLVMMTKTTSKKRVWCSSIAMIPVLIAAICVFSTKSIAQPDMNELPEQTTGSIEITTQDNSPNVTTDLVQDVKQIIESHIEEKNGRKTLNLDAFSKDKWDRIKELYLTKSTEHQAVLDFIFERIQLIDDEIKHLNINSLTLNDEREALIKITILDFLIERIQVILVE